MTNELDPWAGMDVLDDDPTLSLLADTADSFQRELEEDGGDKLARIGRAGKRVQTLESEIKTLEGSIDDRKKEIQELRTKVIPDLLRAVGMSHFSLSDGTTVELKDDVFPDIPAAKREEAYEWLRENGHGDLIKHEIKVTFGMGEDLEALTIKNLLVNHNSPLNFTEKETVLPQSLRAWVREQERKGRELPPDLISVHRVTTAHLKTPKK